MIKLDRKQTSFIKVFLFFFLMALLLLAINIGVKSFFFSEFTEKSAITNAPAKIKERQAFLNDYLANLPRQIEAIATSKPFQAYLYNPQTHVKPFQDLLDTLMIFEPDVMQIRYLSAQGQELLKVDRPRIGADFDWVPPAQLQNKSGRAYVKQALRETSPRTIFSNIELNQEEGEIERPFKPTIRVMRPVFEGQHVRGVLVINYFVSDLLEDLVQAPFYEMALFDGQGQVIKHSNARYDWSAYRTESLEIDEWVEAAGEQVIERLDLPLPSPLYLGLSLNRQNLKAMHANELKEYSVISMVTLLLALFVSAVVSGVIARNQRARDHLLAQLKVAEQVSDMASWEHNHVTGAFSGNALFYKRFGFGKTRRPSFEGYVQALSPSSREHYETDYREALRLCRPVTHVVEVPASSTAGERYFQERYDHLVNRDGQLVSTFGVLVDVTERYQQQAMIQNIIDAQESLILRLDGRRITYANEAFKAFFGGEAKTTPLKDLSDLEARFEPEAGLFTVPENDDDGEWLPLLEQSHGDTVVKMVSQAGVSHYFALQFHSIATGLGVLTMTDITERYLAQQQLMTQANQDALTGAYNRHFFDSFLRGKLENWLSAHCLYGLIVFDIDFFKRINDTYGHGIGDQVLKGMVRVIQDNTRRNDYLIRWGGEEFVLFVETERLDVVSKVAENIREAVAQTDFPSVGQVTLSGGGALLVPGVALEATIEKADQNLYQAKSGGRNQIVVS
ncbi:diguanylate cyclase [Thiomicrospira sp. XS5]|uniref:sensor domain-containing diguanylate cyclase n=1 Tax=Thiomicrospira sp. XS5 TaxID=1775636 RepID=UPI000ACDE40F|nr:diguanylate cyclase [Thiomicrospira sp. XS5]